MELSVFNIASDLSIAVFYLMAIVVIAHTVYKTSYTRGERLQQRKSIFLLFIFVASLIYLFQTIFQSTTYGTSATVWLWDMYNLVQVLANLMAVRTIAEMYGNNIKKDHPRLPIL